MNRRVAAFLGLLTLVLLLVPATVFAQETTPTPGPATYAEVRAKFSGWSQLDAVTNGYQKAPVCVETDAGGMGYHATNSSLVDGAIDPLNPEALLIDARGNVVGVEYITTGAPPADGVFGMEGERFVDDPATSDAVGRDVMTQHVWFIANSNGTFAQYNPAVDCPEGSTAPAPPPTGDFTIPGGWGVYLAAFGVGAVALGLGVARRSASRS